ncbi:hypothetical protein EDD37DRAFT_625124 [Exophiala viscosa]|uniref:Uncharacterized protein n=1 Tax=Exophiala viscosa TaxID=2486360 RepID=A0AAN6IEF3_9EURO|nr:hypothetical protein EDD36DRAFT_239405 [Exophiala viscosa]KAI1625591.1 hypothetical protein EDD37DRAFT_625124 [Exophiala viscosa]
MPTILTPQGWVKVAAPPPSRPKKRVKYDPVRALKGPLSYLSCQPLPPSPNKKTTGNRPQYPYDLDVPPEKLEQQSRTPRQSSRAASAPHQVQEIQYIDEEDYLEELGLQGRLTGSESSRSSRSVTPPPPKSPSRSQRHEHDHHHSPQSARSYARHRPVEAAPRPTSAYHPQTQGGSRDYNNYSAPGSFERPPPPSNARNISYAWYNATTPLNL